jgi:N-acetylmuramoyl-L-alanine amidase
MPRRTGTGPRASIALAIMVVTALAVAACSPSTSTTRHASLDKLSSSPAGISAPAPSISVPPPGASNQVSSAPQDSSAPPESAPASAESTQALVSAAATRQFALMQPSPSRILSRSQSPSPSPSTSSTHAAQPTPTPTPASASTIAPVAGQPLAGKVVVLDPGHNLNNSSSINKTVYAGDGVYKACDTTGTATDAGYPEHAFTWDVANRAAAILRAEGATVILTRPNDTSIGPCITTRAQIGNDAHANAFVAIHADGGPAGGHGFFVMQPPPNNPNVNPGGAAQSRILATVMHDTFHAVTGYPYSTYITNGYYPDTTTTGTINLSHGPVITIECLNMRNSGDAAIATNPTDRQRIAAGIAAGLTAFLTR